MNDQVQAELLPSIDKKIKDAIPELPIENLARLVGLSNSDTLLSERTRNSLDEVQPRFIVLSIIKTVAVFLY